jgi:hypothetical protein
MILGRIKRFPRFRNRNLISSLRKESKEEGVGVARYEECPYLNAFEEGKYFPDSWIGCRFAKMFKGSPVIHVGEEFEQKSVLKSF